MSTSPIFHRWDELEARLSFLETRNSANTKEILELKKNNYELQNEVLVLRRGNFQAKEKIDSMTQHLGVLDTENQRLKSKIVENTENWKQAKNTKDTVANLTKEVTILRGLQKLLSSVIVKADEAQLEKRVGELEERVRGVDNRNEAMYDKVAQVETINVVLFDRLKAVEDKVEVTSDTVKAISNKVKDASGRLEMEVLENEEKITTIRKLVNTIEEKLKISIKDLDVEFKKKAWEMDDIKNSVVRVSIKPSQSLVAGMWAKLDTLIEVSTLGQCFKKDKVEYISPLRGLYGVGLKLVQSGVGTLKVSVKRDDSTLSNGLTTGDNDVCNLFFVSPSAKGRKWSVHVFRKEGNADVRFCDFYCFLLSPL